jgi:hypothetical protein
MRQLRAIVARVCPRCLDFASPADSIKKCVARGNTPNLSRTRRDLWGGDRRAILDSTETDSVEGSFIRLGGYGKPSGTADSRLPIPHCLRAGRPAQRSNHPSTDSQCANHRTCAQDRCRGFCAGGVIDRRITSIRDCWAHSERQSRSDLSGSAERSGWTSAVFAGRSHSIGSWRDIVFGLNQSPGTEGYVLELRFKTA